MLHVLQQLDLLRDRTLLSLANAVHDHLAPGDLVPLLLVVALEDLLEGPMAQLGVELRTQRSFGLRAARASGRPGVQGWAGPSNRGTRASSGAGTRRGNARTHPDIAPVR